MDYIDRMKNELQYLKENEKKLFKGIEKIKGLTDEELGLMHVQLYIMRSYIDVLLIRIKLAEKLKKKNKNNL